jgi:hypothetical protein
LYGVDISIPLPREDQRDLHLHHHLNLNVSNWNKLGYFSHVSKKMGDLDEKIFLMYKKNIDAEAIVFL